MNEDPDADVTRGPAALDLGRLALAEAELAAVEHAMARLDAGRWGTCEACAEPIDATTLEAHPAATTCEAHA